MNAAAGSTHKFVVRRRTPPQLRFVHGSADKPFDQDTTLAALNISEYRQLVLDRLGAESHPAILFGGLSLLQGEGQCWDVLFAGLLSGGVGGCVDARDGRILLVWETPEE